MKGGQSTSIAESYRKQSAGRFTVGTTARALTTQSVLSLTCIVQASHDNGGRVLVGNATDHPFELEAGEAVSVPWPADKTYVRASAGNQVVIWLAGG